MTMISRLIPGIIFPFLISSCSTELFELEKRRLAVDNVTASFDAGAITLRISPDAQLNVWDDISNSCSLLLFQSADKKTLQDLMSNPIIIKQFFSGMGKADGILKVDKYTVMPGQELTLHVDRSEGAKYVSIIAGYYPYPGKQHMLLFDIPVEITEEGLWNKTLNASLAPLVKEIYLGKESIRSIQ